MNWRYVTECTCACYRRGLEEGQRTLQMTVRDGVLTNPYPIVIQNVGESAFVVPEAFAGAYGDALGKFVVRAGHHDE